MNDELVVDTEDEELPERLRHRLETTLKRTGSRILLVFTNSLLAAQILHAADLSAMGGVGYGWVLNSDAMRDIEAIAKNSHEDEPAESFGVLKTGLLGFLEEDWASLQSAPLGSLTSVLTLVVQGYQELGFSLSATELFEYILSNPATPTLDWPLHFDSAGVKCAYYDIYNMQDFLLRKLGSWGSGQREIVYTVDESTIIWPGFSSTAPSDKFLTMKLGLLYPLHSEAGTLFPEGHFIKLGFDLALEEINLQRDLLLEHLLEAEYIDTYRSSSLAAVNLKSTANLNILGFVGPYDSETSKAYAEALKSFSNPKPAVSYAASSAYLNSTEHFPQFLRTVQSDGQQAVPITFILRDEGWERIGVIYTSDDMGVGVYSSLMTNLDSLGIRVANNKDKRRVFFNGAVSSQTVQDIEEALNNIVQNQVKIIVFTGNDTVTPELARAAFHKGLYGEDYAWVGSV